MKEKVKKDYFYYDFGEGKVIENIPFVSNAYEWEEKQLIPILNKAIEDMIKNEKEYRKLEPSNGWGTYDGLLQEFRDLRECCEQNLDGIISVD